MFVCEKCEGVGDHKPGCPDSPMTTTPPPEGTTEPREGVDGRMYCQTCGPNRPAPVVPDSADVRDITDQVRYAWCWYGGATREESDQRAAQFDSWLASFAVVGQGVTAEDRLSGPAVDALSVGSVVLDYEGDAWQKVADGLWVCTDGGSANTLSWPGERPENRVFTILHRAVVRSGEQGGE